MKRSTWNLNGLLNRALQQVEALAARGPDIVALLKFTAHSLPKLRTTLATGRFGPHRGLIHDGAAV